MAAIAHVGPDKPKLEKCSEFHLMDSKKVCLIEIVERKSDVQNK